MAATVYGTAHLYGPTGTVSNATVTDESFDKVAANYTEVKDESGNNIEERFDDLTTEGNLTLVIRSAYTVPEPASLITYNSIEYVITKVGRRASNSTHRIVELGVKKSPGIDYSP